MSRIVSLLGSLVVAALTVAFPTAFAMFITLGFMSESTTTTPRRPSR